jgi:membrane-bound lytic murein transglycosylase A
MHRRLRPLARAAALGVALVLAACVQRPPSVAVAPVTMNLEQVSFSALPGWNKDSLAPALAAFRRGCTELAHGDPARQLGGTGETAALGGVARDWLAACAAAARVPAADDAAARQFFETHFQPYAITANGNPDGLFTGYFEPEVRGARSPGGVYRTPLLGRPHDLVEVNLGEFAADLHGREIDGRVEDGRLVPYWDRAAIERGVLDRQRLGLLWLADPIDAFILQIQGSGRVRLPDGHIVRVTYAAQNGRRYVPIGRVLADRGAIPLDLVSLQSIRAWLEAHPGQAKEVMDQNPSYVFFRELDNVPPQDGPPGALGAPLTPRRSIAVDRHFLPLGAPVWIVTTDPLTGSPLQRLMMAQDIGGEIRGPVRADIFWGWGPQAEARAGKMRERGSAFVLLPKPSAGP